MCRKSSLAAHLPLREGQEKAYSRCIVWALPIAGLNVAPDHIPERDYSAVPVDNLRTYPVYHPDHEPKDYQEWLKQQRPKPLIEPEKLKTEKEHIMFRSVHTDPGLALKTRKGTGLYKVPSLSGLWYCGLLEHSGSVATIEDWFDPERLREDYVPTGWKGPGVKTRAVKGHEFGLDLPEEDRKALIAFLKTL